MSCRIAVVSLFVGLLFCSTVHMRAADDPCVAIPLPVAANAALEAHFPGFRVVSLRDLDEDERSAWEAAHPRSCPGIAHGKFDPKYGDAYAVSLIKPLGQYRYTAALILLVKEGDKYAIVPLSPPTEVAGHVLVVWQQAAGYFKDVTTGKKIKTVWPIITYEAIEAGATAYYWGGAGYRSFALSQ